ncbi:hypothetical protein JCM16303_001287 [Sporobolomyces ruberrimus]
MAPQAYLTFEPSTVTSPPDGFDLNSIGSFALWPSPHSPHTQHSSNLVTPVLSHPAPLASPALNVTGPFSLHKGGVVQVGELQVRIDPGTFVGRCEGLGAVGQESRGLWWHGTGTTNDKGVWTLQLLRATDADAVAVHRLLLYLPPLSNPPPPPLYRPHSPPVEVRNSLILYDHHHNRVVSIVPLEGPSRPARGPLPPLPISKPLPRTPSPPPRPLSPGARIAEYVDRVVQGIHPDPTPDSLSAAERLEQGRIARQAEKEEDAWRDPFGLEDILIAVPPTRSVVESGSSLPSEDKEETQVVKLDRAESQLSLGSSSRVPTESSDGAAPSAVDVGLSPSEWSGSSLATFGSERVNPDNEGDAETLKPSTVASFIEGSYFLEPATVQDPSTRGEDPDPAPTATRPVESRTSNSPQPATNTFPVQFDPAHTLTNGNAVLLSFLGAPSILSPSATRIKVSAHALSKDQVSEQVTNGTIELVEVDQRPGGGEEGWWNWLTMLLKRGESDDPCLNEVDGSESSSRGWFTWFTWPWSVDRGCEENDSLETRALRLPGRMDESGTTRLSVLYIDHEGRGSRAFVSKGK